jgi:cellulose synthase/poly-beta-1,6-N-acetylglucosamine synthase-like glycosyltransferase
MDFWYEYAKLESLVQRDRVSQARNYGRSLLLQIEKADHLSSEVQFLLDFFQFHGIELHGDARSITDAVDCDVDHHSDNRKNGVSLVTASRNRTENLVRSLQTWLEIPEIDEILIIDWSSDNDVYSDLQKLGWATSKVRVVRINEQPGWVLSYAFNLGFRLASYDTILKADADITLSIDFLLKTNSRSVSSWLAIGVPPTRIKSILTAFFIPTTAP